MTILTSIVDIYPKSQFGADSYPHPEWNCRPTADAMIASFYLDHDVSVHNMRTAMGAASDPDGINVVQGKRGLDYYKIPSSWAFLTIAQLKAKLDANIPVDISVNYGYIPDNYKQDKVFNGGHSMVAVAIDQYGELYVKDPDHWGAALPNYTILPPYAWHNAYFYYGNGSSTGLCLFPNSPKKFTYPYSSVLYHHTVRTLATLNVRSAPYTSAKIDTQLARGHTFAVGLKTTHGGSYRGPNGKVYTTWLAFDLHKGGPLVWVAEAYTALVK